MMKKYCRAYIFITTIFVLVAFFETDVRFFIFYPCILCGMIPVTLMGYDEKNRWLQYSATLPYTRKQIVSEKYLLGVIIQIIIMTFICVTQGLGMYLNGSLEMENIIVLFLMLIPVGSIGASISVPFIFKYGVEKGRSAYYIMVGVVCACCVIASNVFKTLTTITVKVNIILSVVAIIGIGMYILSWYSSVLIFQKKEL